MLAALSRIFWESLLRRYREWAKSAGYAPSAVGTGAITGVHRAGASLNVHVHFHLLCLDALDAMAPSEERASCIRFPIVDGGIPSITGMRSVLDTIDLSIAAKRPVYHHGRRFQCERNSHNARSVP